MTNALRLSVGQYSDRGRKPANQDFHGAAIPDGPPLALKGVAVALADGISSSAVSAVAAEAAVTGFLADYVCTPDTWSVKTAAVRVINALNAWLHAETRRSRHPGGADHGYVCTFTVLVAKGDAAHIFHVGDARVYRLAGTVLEQLTDDHRVRLSQQEVYLGRALGVNPHVEIDYRVERLQQGDVFILATDGVYEHVTVSCIIETISAASGDLDIAARRIVDAAYANGSDDNLTVQIVRIDAVPDQQAGGFLDEPADLPPAPLLDPGALFEGYTIIRELHATSRSHVYLALEPGTSERVVLKVPSIDLRNDPAYLRHFMLEDWIARRIDNVHVLKPRPRLRPRQHLYLAMSHIDGCTLTQWMADHPAPDLEQVRDIVAQIAVGLQAFHRRDMLHRDLRPDNIMIDRNGTAIIIDFGAVHIAGVSETLLFDAPDPVPGTVQYTAPEYLLGATGTERSDLFSLGVITYQMITGRLPYGAEMARARTRPAQRRATYRPAASLSPALPRWVDAALRRAVHPDPAQRQEAVSEFIAELRRPNPAYTRDGPLPLVERNPVRFWQCVAALLACALLWLLAHPLRL